MGDVFLLGAGFSRAVCPTMPTMKELFEELEPLIGNADGFSRQAYEYADRNVETLLSYYAIPNPSDDPIERLRKQRVTALLELGITLILSGKERDGDESGLNPNGAKLVNKWHQQQSHVLTANYDTLVERMAGAHDDTQVSNLYPIAVIPSPAIMGHNPSGTITGPGLKLYKLHGSVSWYTSQGESNSGPIYGHVGFGAGAFHPWEKLLGDKRCFIVPPVHDKSTLLSHESIRSIWRQANRYVLREASRLYVIGYSLPETDMAMRTLLWEGRRSGQGSFLPKIPLCLVDTDPCIVKHYSKTLGKYYDVEGTYTGGNDAFDRFVEAYV